MSGPRHAHPPRFVRAPGRRHRRSPGRERSGERVGDGRKGDLDRLADHRSRASAQSPPLLRRRPKIRKSEHGCAASACAAMKLGARRRMTASSGAVLSA